MRRETLKEMGGVRLHGDVAEMYFAGTKVGLAFKWTFEGSRTGWYFEAERYRLDRLIMSGRRDVEIRFDHTAGHLRARGTIWNDGAIADGQTHRGIVVKGAEVTWNRQRPVVAKTA